MSPLLRRRRQRWDFAWEFPGGLIVELRADDPRAVEFGKKKDQLRALLKRETISSAEYVERFKGLCLELGKRVDRLPEGYALWKEYAVGKVYSKKSRPET